MVKVTRMCFVFGSIAIVFYHLTIYGTEILINKKKCKFYFNAFNLDKKTLICLLINVLLINLFIHYKMYDIPVLKHWFLYRLKFYDFFIFSHIQVYYSCITLHSQEFGSLDYIILQNFAYFHKVITICQKINYR